MGVIVAVLCALEGWLEAPMCYHLGESSANSDVSLWATKDSPYHWYMGTLLLASQVSFSSSTLKAYISLF